MARTSGRTIELALVALIVLLTLATGYVHYIVGGIMLTLNALGYLGLALLVAGAALFYRRLLPMVLVVTAAYAVVTILGWLVMGPYYDVAYLAKAIEVALIATIAVTLWRLRREARESLDWVRSKLGR
jgi:hypothetical protein